MAIRICACSFLILACIVRARIFDRLSLSRKSRPHRFLKCLDAGGRSVVMVIRDPGGWLLRAARSLMNLKLWDETPTCFCQFDREIDRTRSVFAPLSDFTNFPDVARSEFASPI